MKEADKLVAGFPFGRGWSLALHILRKTHPHGDKIGLCRARLLKETVLDEDSSDDPPPEQKKVLEHHNKWKSFLSRPLVRQVSDSSSVAPRAASGALSSSSSALDRTDSNVSPSSSSSSSSSLGQVAALSSAEEASRKRQRK